MQLTLIMELTLKHSDEHTDSAQVPRRGIAIFLVTQKSVARLCVKCVFQRDTIKGIAHNFFFFYRSNLNYRPLRPKSAIPHPITIQNMRFER